MNLRVDSSVFMTGYGNNVVSKDSFDGQEGNGTKRMARELLRTQTTVTQPNQKKTFVGVLDEDKNPLAMYKMTDDSKDDEEVVVKKLNYNANELANSIQRAKTSTSAAGTVSKVKRKVAELKRKLASKDVDTSEVQLALAHARNMERVATKKKRHLELEELVDNARRNHHNQDEDSDVKINLHQVLEDEIEECSQDKIDKLYKQMEALMDEYRESDDYSSDFESELIQNMDDMMSEFEEIESKTLAETLDIFEAMEVADPNMSEADFKMFKIKHRNSENKDIVKANMEYLKSMIEHYEKSPTASVPNIAPIVSSTAGELCVSGVNADVSIDIKV